jgi:uncharacterized protein (DUF1499 family)
VRFIDWFTKNTYATRTDAAEPLLRPRNYCKSITEVLAAVQAAVRAIPGWTVVETRETERDGKLHATRTTRLWRFVDDINVELSRDPGPNAVATLNVHSKSRVGAADFGQNRRNILELVKQLDARITSEP